MNGVYDAPIGKLSDGVKFIGIILVFDELRGLIQYRPGGGKRLFCLAQTCQMKGWEFPTHTWLHIQ